MSWRIDYPRAKLLVDPRDWRILGCHLVGPDASTVLHEVLAVMRHVNDVRRIPEIIHIHPAVSEVHLSTAISAIQKVRRWRRENGAEDGEG